MKSVPAGMAVLCASALALAGCQSGYQTMQDKKAQVKPAPQKPAKAPVSGDSYTVQAGDTVFGIAFRAGLNYRDVASWNGIGEPYTIRVGQTLRLSPPASYAGNANPKKPPSQQTTPGLLQTKAKPVTAVPADPSKPPEPVLSNIDWQWPTRGEIIGRFVVDDKTKQGINIAGRPGQEIQAAADGVVVYSGTGLIGYGELLIVKHSNEWISAYAHNSKRLVDEGAKVRAGQHIADMGDTGSISTMLHFEIRRNGKPVDPLLYLPER